jgi:superfamily II DNA or RNA helicase
MEKSTSPTSLTSSTSLRKRPWSDVAPIEDYQIGRNKTGEGCVDALSSSLDDGFPVQTPHTLRLLKLVQDGTTEHAQLAAEKLEEICGQVASPLILWDLLGRLQCLLISPQWRTRQNAQLAMERVARNIPPQDQMKFLQEVFTSHDEPMINEVGADTCRSPSSFLTLKDLNENLTTILELGRPLLAIPESKYQEHMDEMQLENLRGIKNNENIDGEKIDFCSQRLEMQRRILAHRLGLSDVITRYSCNVGTRFQRDLLQEGFAALESNEVASKKYINGKQKKKMKESDETTEPPRSIRALLVREIRQQQQRHQEQQNRSAYLSHRKPQNLLVGELVYRMFDAFWYVRHGSLMGILALLRAWNAHLKGVDQGIGTWPYDVLVRTLCVLALDRFGDFSGTSTDDYSGSMVAPVRAMAGQVFSIIFIMAPEYIQRQSTAALSVLARSECWETRHGALVASKYTLSLMYSIDSIDFRWKSEFESHLTSMAMTGLNDDSDDVKGVAAQVLIQRAKKGDRQSDGIDEIHLEIARHVWESLEGARLFASSLEDLVALFTQTFLTNFESASKYVAPDGTVLDSMVSVFARFSTLLESECVSVKASIVHAIGLLGSLIPCTVASWKCSLLPDPLNADDTSTVDVPLPNSFKQCFCELVKTIYGLFIKFCSVVANHKGNSDETTLLKECSETWKVLSASKDAVFLEPDPLLAALEKYLLVDFFHLSERKVRESDELTKTSSNRKIAMRLETARVVASFWALSSVTARSFGRNVILCFCLLAGLESPLTFHCEASCCLIRALLETKSMNASLSQIMKACILRMVEILSAAPVCRSYNLTATGTNQKYVEFVLRSFQGGFPNSTEADDITAGSQAASRVVNIWQQFLPAQISSNDVPLTMNYMRLTSQIAGTVVSQKLCSLPNKLSHIVRPLMTSLQNEAAFGWQRENCEYLSCLLVTLCGATAGRQEGVTKTLQKILSTVCNLLFLTNEPACTGASLVVGIFVHKMPCAKLLFSCKQIWEKLSPLCDCWVTATAGEKRASLCMLQAVCQRLSPDTQVCATLIDTFVPTLVHVGCDDEVASFRECSVSIVTKLCSCDGQVGLNKAVPALILFLKDGKRHTSRGRACTILTEMIAAVSCPSTISPFVRELLPIAMSLMTDSTKDVATNAACLFSRLVQIAPLVVNSTCSMSKPAEDIDLVMEHLIHGKKLPHCKLPDAISKHLIQAGITLRDYQLEGISWLRFLQQTKLNGALCDSMGLGKTASALIAIALSHLAKNNVPRDRRSLVVCPSSIVGHWMSEIKRFLPNNSTFDAICLVGDARKRKSLLHREMNRYSLVITSYSVLRSDIENFCAQNWDYVVLDEGHLLKNPKTATARAARRLRSQHRLVLSGTPVQNHVQEVWAIFDFLMPHFLGSSDQFSKEFGRPISKGQKVHSCAADVAVGIEKLIQLHQQVLPFILRREKDEVLKELPPKIITRIPCPMSPLQETLYHHFCRGPQGKQSLLDLQECICSSRDADINVSCRLGKSVLRSLLYLRLLCTHPWLVRSRSCHEETDGLLDFLNIEASGKLLALREILRDSGLRIHDHSAADNDSSLLYCEKGEDNWTSNEYEQTVSAGLDDLESASDESDVVNGGSKCLIFAQFMDSLDIVEDVVLRRYMPSTRYLRLDRSVPQSKRAEIVDTFNREDRIKVLLLTTKIGGLGLNLTGADTVIFLEHDWNPHADLQAMDRAHRLGQNMTVQVYQLVTENSIEEQIMAMHEKKMAMSKAIINSDNSSLYSVGTERLLDIFHYRSEVSFRSTATPGFQENLDALVERYGDEYQSLSVNDFVQSFDESKNKQNSFGGSCYL